MEKFYVANQMRKLRFIQMRKGTQQCGPSESHRENLIENKILKQSVMCLPGLRHTDLLKLAGFSAYFIANNIF